MPWWARSRIAPCASLSRTVIVPVRPARRTGHAAADGVAQSMPASAVPGVATVTGRPAASDAVTHAAATGSTTMTAAGGRWWDATRTAEAASDPTPIGTMTTPNGPAACAAASRNSVV